MKTFFNLREATSTRDYVDTMLGRACKRDARLPDCKITKKTGFTSYKFENGMEIVNDGVGIKVKFDGKEIAYFDKPKLNYKNAIAKVKA